MSFLDSALALAQQEFHVFPLATNAKAPPKDSVGAYKNGTRNLEQIKKWWGENPTYNIGISTHKYNGTQALLVVDVDIKPGRSGFETIERLKREGKILPDTLTQETASGGRHFIYAISEPVNQRKAGYLGLGLDVRSYGGYIVAAGSKINGKPYRFLNQLKIMPAPEWLISALGKPEPEDPTPKVAVANIDMERAIRSSKEYLDFLPSAISGERNAACFAAACKLKDFGVDQNTCERVMLEHWKCEPMLELDEFENTIRSAYKHGKNAVGSASPEAQFTPIPVEVYDPHREVVEKLNEEYAFIIIGRSYDILWETTDELGNFQVKYLDFKTFQDKHASQTVLDHGKFRTITDIWKKHPHRRSYDGLVFMPEQKAPERFYNLWRGFSVKPLGKDEKPTARAEKALAMYLEHAKENVCLGNEEHFRWVMGWFAQMFQKPWLKPLTALVFKGGKGVGKNALIDRIGHLLGNHYLLTSNQRYLTSNFNAHLEYLLFFACNEAFWSGNNQADSILKELVTGTHHVIERKNKEAYRVKNLARVCVLGNEDWLVPASEDERRYAVFNVGVGRKQDVAFFQEIQEGMEAGGYRLLLKYLLEFNLTDINLNIVPKTQGLLDQKEESLGLVQKWLLNSLRDGRFVGGDFTGGWGEKIEKERLRSAFVRYCRDRGISTWLPDGRKFSRQIKKCMPSLDTNAKNREGPITISVFEFPTLEKARKEWAEFMGQEMKWE